MRIVIASFPNKEKVVAEIYDGENQWAELSQEHDSLILEIYPCEDTKAWTFQYQDVIDILKEAEHKLLGKM
jgi:hypothetical protein